MFKPIRKKVENKEKLSNDSMCDKVMVQHKWTMKAMGFKYEPELWTKVEILWFSWLDI